MQAKKFLVLDSETTGLGKNAIVFDLAYTIATRKNVLVERSFLVREILTNPATMLRAIGDDNWREFAGGKIFSHYIPALNSGMLVLHNWSDILETMRDDILTYGVDVFSAYNLKFDLGALNKTHNKLTEKSLDFSRLDLLCLWEFACVTVCDTAGYHNAARQFGNEWITPANNVRTNAEKVYAFLTGNFDFIESHTALEDAQIETEILQRLLAKKRTIPYNVIDHMPWKKAQKNVYNRRIF
jgi:DNA polymerase III epsilon subunit-like protein